MTVREKLLQIRLSEEELARIKELAGDIPVSQYARGVLLQKYVTATGSMEKVEIADAEERTAMIGGSVPIGPKAVVHPQQFKQMFARLQAKLPLDQAEAEARKRLGMEE